MKTSIVVAITLVVLGSSVALLAQAPAPEANRVVVEQRPDGTLIYRSPDGKVEMVRPGNVPPGAVVYAGPSAHDPEAAKLYQEELQAAQQAQKLAGDLRSAESEGDREKIKTQLREKLLAIFDLQQKRRQVEVTKIEERLAKLKETMKKRDAAKDSIVDRRLDVLTGGVDELGWEDTFGTTRDPNYPSPRYVPTAPVPATNALPPAVAPPLAPPATRLPPAAR